MLNVLARLFGAIANEGLPTHSSTVMLSSPGVVQSELAALRWNFTSTELTCPGSALSGPETGPVRRISGLSHHTPEGSCVPPSPVTASIKKQVSEARPGSFGIGELLSECQQLKILRSVCRVCYPSHQVSSVFHRPIDLVCFARSIA